MHTLQTTLTFFHFVSIFGLLGTLLFIRWVSTPIMRRLAPHDSHAVPLLIDASERLIVPEWTFATAALLTGVPLMLMNPAYHGFMNVAADNRWAVLMFIKHVAFGALFVSMALYTWVVYQNKKLIRAQPNTPEGDRLDIIGRRMDRLATLCGGLAVGALGITSFLANQGRPWVVALLKTLHIGFISAWVGGMFFVVFIGTPLVAKYIKRNEMTLVQGIGHMHMVAARFIKVLWMAMFAAIFTGFPLLFLDDRYAAFLKHNDGLNNTMLVKVIVFLIMILGAFEVTPAIIRLGEFLKLAAREHSVSSELITKIQKERRTMALASRYGLSFGVVMLMITAVMMVIKVS